MSRRTWGRLKPSPRQEAGVPVTVFRCVHIFGPPEHPGPTAPPFIAGLRAA